MKSKNPISRKDNIVVQELDGEVLIYDLSKNKAFCLNETSSIIWDLCDGNNSLSDISSEVSNKLNAKASEELVWLALDQLKKENLLANGDELEVKFDGLSRRDVIKRVGLGTMVALPIVSGLVAPRSAQASSVGGPCKCTGSGTQENAGCSCPTNPQNSCRQGLTCIRGNANNGTPDTCVAVYVPPPGATCLP